MRIPVFARGSNPAIDRRILVKSRFYAETEVAEGRADWVDYNDPRKGIVCRELLHFGTREIKAETVEVNWAELPGIKFVPPKMELNPTIVRLQFDPLALRLLRKERLMLNRRKEAEQASA